MSVTGLDMLQLTSPNVLLGFVRFAVAITCTELPLPVAILIAVAVAVAARVVKGLLLESPRDRNMRKQEMVQSNPNILAFWRFGSTTAVQFITYRHCLSPFKLRSRDV